MLFTQVTQPQEEIVSIFFSLCVSFCMFTCGQQIKFHDILPRNYLDDLNGGNTFTAYSSTCLVFLKVHACRCIAATFYIKPGHRTKWEYWGVNKLQLYNNSLSNWLHEECVETAWQPGNYLTTAWQLPDNCLKTAWQLPHYCHVCLTDCMKNA